MNKNKSELYNLNYTFIITIVLRLTMAVINVFCFDLVI